jgi:hypothetical protein
LARAWSASAQEALLPRLENPRQERFAQGLAAGLTQRRAYAEAGYPNPKHAYRLANQPQVKTRVAELMERASIRAEINLATVTRSLVRLAGRAEDDGAARGLSAARAAWSAAAKLNRLTADRSDAAKERVGGTISDRPQTQEGG